MAGRGNSLKFDRQLIPKEISWQHQIIFKIDLCGLSRSVSERFGCRRCAVNTVSLEHRRDNFFGRNLPWNQVWYHSRFSAFPRIDPVTLWQRLVALLTFRLSELSWLPRQRGTAPTQRGLRREVSACRMKCGDPYWTYQSQCCKRSKLLSSEGKCCEVKSEVTRIR